MGTTNRKFNTEFSKQRIKELLDLLTTKPLTRIEIGEKVEFGMDAVCGFVEHMHKSKPKMIYIKSYKDQGKKMRRLCPVFAVGNKPDAPKPAPKTKAQVCKDYRERTRERLGDKEYKHKVNYKVRARRFIKKPKQPDFAASWIRPLTPEERAELDNHQVSGKHHSIDDSGAQDDNSKKRMAG